MFDIQLVAIDLSASAIDFRIVSAEDKVWADFRLTVGGDNGFGVAQTSGPEIKFCVGTIESRVQSWLSSYPPLVRFVDLSERGSTLMAKPAHPRPREYVSDRFHRLDR